MPKDAAKDPYVDLPDDFKIPLYPKGVDLPDEMRVYWLGRIKANAEAVDDLEKLLTLARMIRDRSILNARISSNVEVKEIADLLGVSLQAVYAIEKRERGGAERP